MSRIRSKDTTPEIILRKALHSRGFRFRLHYKTLPGKPDIVLPKYRTVIFVNGCFWHGHANCRYSTIPKTNSEFWEEKISRNRERDALCVGLLQARSWNVIVVWECELKHGSIDDTVKGITAQILKYGEEWHNSVISRKENNDRHRAEQKKKRERRATIEAELMSRFGITPSALRLSEKLSDD